MFLFLIKFFHYKEIFILALILLDFFNQYAQSLSAMPTPKNIAYAFLGRFKVSRFLFTQTNINNLLKHSCSIASSVMKSTLTQDIHLNLIFDINKTIILEDPATQKTDIDVLNEVLADCTWGVIGSQGEWCWSGLPPCTKPELSRSTNTSFGTGTCGKCLTYSDYLDVMFEDKPGLLKEQKKARDLAKASFTNDGHPGFGLSHEFERLHSALQLPSSVKLSKWARAAGLHNRRSFFLLPSFLECILELQRNNVSFSLQFRTFGLDIERVQREFNAFCRGEHPLNEGHVFMDGRQGTLDYTIDLSHPERFGTFYRSPHTTQLILGTLDQPTYEDHEQDYTSAYEKVYRGKQGITVYEGFKAIRGALDRLQRDPLIRTVALRDFYPHWRQNFERVDAGKLFLTRDSKFESQSSIWKKEIEIFFDDNIEDEDDHIIDLKSCRTGKKLNSEERKISKGFVIKAEPYHLILRSFSESESLGKNFFLSMIKTSVTAQKLNH